LPDNTTQTASGCVKCGACSTVCPVFQAEGHESFTARGKFHLLDRLPSEERTELFEEIFSKCLLCGACKEACPGALDTPLAVIRAREGFSRLTGISFLKFLARKALLSPTLYTGLNATATLLVRLLPEDSGLRLRLAGTNPGHVLPGPGFIESFQASNKSASTSDQQTVSYFTGCLANFIQPEIGSATVDLLRHTGSEPNIPQKQTCCGLAAQGAGESEEARRLARINISAFADNSTPILTSCASCYAHLLSYPKLFTNDAAWHDKAEKFSARLIEFSTYFSRSQLADQDSNELFPSTKKQVLYHDPCHLRLKLHITQPPRQLLRNIKGLSLVELPQGPVCCGQGGLFQLSHPVLADRISKKLLADIERSAPKMITSTCSGCLLHLQNKASCRHDVEVQHLAVLLKKHLLTK